jgi:hypothetical protein
MNKPPPSGPLPLSQEFQVRRPVEEQGFMVTDSDWAYLRNKVSNIGPSGVWYNTAGSIALGIAGSALVGALTVPKDLSIYDIPSKIICGTAFLICVISGSMAFYFSSAQRKVSGRTIEDAMEEMNRIEKRCRPK